MKEKLKIEIIDNSNKVIDKFNFENDLCVKTESIFLKNKRNQYQLKITKIK